MRREKEPACLLLMAQQIPRSPLGGRARDPIGIAVRGQRLAASKMIHPSPFPPSDLLRKSGGKPSPTRGEGIFVCRGDGDACLVAVLQRTPYLPLVGSSLPKGRGELGEAAISNSSPVGERTASVLPPAG